MSRNTNNKGKNYRSRSSLAKPKNSNRSYKERIVLSGKEGNGVDFGAPINAAGYMLIL